MTRVSFETIKNRSGRDVVGAVASNPDQHQALIAFAASKIASHGDQDPEGYVQTAYLKVLAGTYSADEIRHPETLLKRIISNLVVNTIRSADYKQVIRTADTFEETLGDQVYEPDFADRLTTEVSLEGVVERLSPAQRQAVSLFIVEDLGSDELSEKLGKSKIAIRTAASRGIDTLRKNVGIDWSDFR